MPDTAARTCGFVPYPGNGAYGHWRCGRRRFHLGPHRFINYTIARIPRVWHVRELYREIRTTRRLRRVDKPGYLTPYRFRRALYPATYKPLPADISPLAEHSRRADTTPVTAPADIAETEGK